MLERQRQEAGDNSQQIQATTVIVNNGIDEKRAREIVDEKLHDVITGYTQEAHTVAESRIQLFANDLIPKLVKESLLDELKDPSVQILLKEAQKTAASSERSVDYALLSELLIHRVKRGNDRIVRAGVSRAIEIVDEISDEALLGLTVAHSISTFIPKTGGINHGIKVLANLFKKIIYDFLPSGNEWIEHLGTLGALRIHEFGSMKKIDQFYPEQISGYVDVGIDKTSDDFHRAIAIVTESDLPLDTLCDHELRPGYSRLNLASIDKLDTIIMTVIEKQIIDGHVVSVPVESRLSDEQKQAIRNIYTFYNKDSILKNENVREFVNLWNSYEVLNKLRVWWDSIPLSFSITTVGKVLAHANAQRCDPNVPALS